MRTRLSFLALLAASVLAGCSGVAPSIDRISWQLALQVSPQNQRYETLSLFVLAYDKDGLEDLEEAYLVWLEDGTSWWIPNESWLMQESSSDFRWLTHTALLPPADGLFPRGSYRVFLYDLAGQSTSLYFSINTPTPTLEGQQVPLARPFGSELIVDQVAGSNPMLRGYDYGGALLFQQPLQPGSINYSQLRQQYSELAKLMLDFRLGTLPVRVGPYSVF